MSINEEKGLNKKVIEVECLDGRKAINTYDKRAKGLIKNEQAVLVDNKLVLLKNQYKSNSIYLQARFWNSLVVKDEKPLYLTNYYNLSTLDMIHLKSMRNLI